jgi:hypothetical protein
LKNSAGLLTLLSLTGLGQPIQPLLAKYPRTARHPGLSCVDPFKKSQNLPNFCFSFYHLDIVALSILSLPPDIYLFPFKKMEAPSVAFLFFG